MKQMSKTEVKIITPFDAAQFVSTDNDFYTNYSSVCGDPYNIRLLVMLANSYYEQEKITIPFPIVYVPYTILGVNYK